MNNINITKKWIEHYVIKLNLCPFAINPFLNKRICFEELTVNDTVKLEKILTNFIDSTNKKIDTTLIILAELSNFNAFLDFYYGLEDLIEKIDEFENIKLVGFHPKYQHGGSIEDVLSYSNIAPVPIVQLLKKDDVKIKTKLIDSSDILSSNESKLKKAGEVNLQNMIDELKR